MTLHRPFEHLWRRASAEVDPNAQGAAGELVAALAQVIGVEYVDYANFSGCALFLIDFSELGFSELSLNALMVSHRPRSPVEEEEQANLLQDYKDAVKSVGFCFHLLLDDEGQPQSEHASLWPEIITIERIDLERIFTANVANSALFQVIRRQVHLTRLNPYSTTREARGGMFRGRRSELRDLTTRLRENYVVAGARRIGKTSLLKRAYDVLRAKEGTEGMSKRTFYFDCRFFREDFVPDLIAEMNPRRRVGDWHARESFFYLKKASANGRRPLLLFLDEADDMVDQDERVRFHGMKQLAVAHEYVRLVLAGYRSMAKLTSANSPHFGKLASINLDALTQKDAAQLITEPFRQLDIRMPNAEHVGEHIWQATRGYPFVIQFYGDELFQIASSREPAEVTADDVREVEQGQKLGPYMFRQFIESTHDSTKLIQYEVLAALMLAHANAVSWTEADFYFAFRSHGVECDPLAINDVVENLKKAKVLFYSAGQYAFVLPVLRDLIRMNYPDLSLTVSAMCRSAK